MRVPPRRPGSVAPPTVARRRRLLLPPLLLLLLAVGGGSTLLLLQQQHRRLAAGHGRSGEELCAGAAAAARPYLHPALHSTREPSSSSSQHDHLVAPRDAEVAASRQQLQRYLDSDAFAAQKRQQATPDGRPLQARGILVVAGGRKLLTHLIVQLQVLRGTLNCTLPVEVACQGPREMDNATLAALQRRYGPLSSFDVQAMPMPPVFARVELSRWVGKVAALLHCSFRQVLLLDSDNLPLADPAPLFREPLFLQQGFLAWPDFWDDWVKPGVWQLLGLNRSAVQPLLVAGAGGSGRDAESGQLLVDRQRWLAALHWVMWLNSMHGRLYYSHLHGDKDTFALGWALAGHAASYRQVVVPPGGAFRWGRGQLEVKCNAKAAPGGRCNTTDGWQLVGALQHDNTGRPWFFHRTMNKLSLDEPPWPLEALTGPLPQRWLRYHLAHNSQGPTKGVWWEHVAPRDALQLLHLDAAPTLMLRGAPAGAAWRTQPAHLRDASGSCPALLYVQYAQARQLALPVDAQPALECACAQLARALQQLPAASAAANALSPEYLVADGGPPDGSPVPALAADGGGAAQDSSTALAAIRASEVALAWLSSEEGRAAFPSLFDGSMA